MSARKEAHRFLLRLPPELHGRVAEAAHLYRRSMNSEIIARLEHSLSGIPVDDEVAPLEPAHFRYSETTFRKDLSNEEDELIRLYRRLSRTQRRALVELLGAPAGPRAAGRRTRKSA